MYVFTDEKEEKEEVIWTILLVIIAYFMTNILMFYRKKERVWTNIIYEDKKTISYWKIFCVCSDYFSLIT